VIKEAAGLGAKDSLRRPMRLVCIGVRAEPAGPDRPVPHYVKRRGQAGLALIAAVPGSGNCRFVLSPRLLTPLYHALHRQCAVSSRPKVGRI